MTARNKHGSEFYEKLAPLYHLKVDWDMRLPKERPLFDLLFTDNDISAVCDLGCGDGGHASEIVRRGAVYVGIDNSVQMIKMAREKNARIGGVHFTRGDMLGLPSMYNGMFDVVLLIGNTLPHVLFTSDLQKLIRSVKRLLSPSGRFVIQTVNPGVLETEQVHFLPTRLAHGRVLFTPFYVRRKRLWGFFMPIFIIEKNRVVSHSTLETQLRFWQRSEIAAAVRQHFRITHVFGNSVLAPYVRAKSENLILIMKKS